MQKRYIKLSKAEREALDNYYKRGKSASTRNRCRAILLSDQGYDIDTLVEIFGACRQSIYRWFNRYEQKGIEGLKVQGGSGHPPKLDINNEATVKTVKRLIQQEPQNMNKVVAQLEQELGIQLSRRTLTRFLKKLVSDGNDSAEA